MRAHRSIRCLVAAGLILGLTNTTAQAAGADAALEVRTGLHKDFTRLVLETPTPVPYKFAFPAADEIVITVTGAIQPDRAAPPAQGIIQNIAVTAGDHGSRLTIKTRARADIRRQFTILPKDGKGARIVIDIAATGRGTEPAEKPAPKKDPVALPPPHTSITGHSSITDRSAADRNLPRDERAIPRPAPLPKQAHSRAPAPASAKVRPTEPFEVAAAGGAVMLFDTPPAHEIDRPLEIAQAGGISINDWLRREEVNPNVHRQGIVPARPAANPPAPPAYPAVPVYRAPAATPIPARGASAYPAYGTYPAAPAPQTHPAHPGYRRPTATSPAAAPVQAPVRRQAAAPPPPADNSPAARYARQKYEAPVEAQTIDRPRRFYAGFGLGPSWVEYESNLNNTTLDGSSAAWNLVGGYRLTRNLALEVGLGNIGTIEETTPSGTTTSSDYYAFTLNGLVSLPLNRNWSPFAKAGFNVWRESAESDTASPREDSGAGLNFGLGADFHLSDRFALRGEWAFYFFTDEIYANTLTASILYNF
ncbi:MAG: outer membrane beta-barrel protein [Rhodospirillales bacterium]